LVSLSHVAYKSSFKYDVRAINEVAKKNGVLNLWDLSHSIGAVKIDVKEMAMDMAVGCTYKFLNGGPGAPAFIYINKALSKQVKNPISGWFSHTKPFDFDQNFESNATAKGFLVGTPPILSLKGIESGVDLFLENNQNLVWAKSKKLFEYFNELFDSDLKTLGFEIGTPIDFEQRGSHIALLHEEAYRINLSLINPKKEKGKVFITDHRPPNIIRIALTPLYQSFEELYELVLRLKNIMSEQEYLQHSIHKTGVI
jgi:kynureninase